MSSRVEDNNGKHPYHLCLYHRAYSVRRTYTHKYIHMKRQRERKKDRERDRVGRFILAFSLSPTTLRRIYTIDIHTIQHTSVCHSYVIFVSDFAVSENHFRSVCVYLYAHASPRVCVCRFYICHSSCQSSNFNHYYNFMIADKLNWIVYEMPNTVWTCSARYIDAFITLFSIFFSVS